MEVVALSGGNAPFKREVHEWQHIDAKTGALLSGRLEADRYVNGNTNQYGKSLSQNIQTSDGIHSQHKQMNILQTITSNGGALQVIQAQTVQKSSSRRAITSTTYSSHFSSNFTNGVGHGSFSSGHPMSSDLLSINPRPLHHHETAPRLKALLSSPPSHLAAGTSSASTDNTSNRRNHLFHHANNDMNQNVVGTEQSRQQQLNEMLYGNGNKESFTLRGRSASIEELANIDGTSFDGDDEPCEWKRVSKIRRSLQFPKTSETRRVYTRPPDLPENSVNVWKIKQDIENLENGRRLNTAMRNNHVDFVALDSILKDSAMESLSSQHENNSDDSKSNCITADSLKEIRRRLKKLNNGHDVYKDEMTSIDENFTQKLSLEQNSKSLELRKNREGNTEDWLNRRKSYGFEKMHQPAETFNGIESSTDSGLGRSSDLASNWSPTVDSQRTIITFGDKKKPATTSISLFSNPKSPESSEKPIPMRRSTADKKDELKRHSIAVDESRYVDEHCRTSNDRKISLVNLNGAHVVDRSASNDGRHKKVEFCKTEIHFAADSGRVNIVETDGKPPPTSNFRRRRRVSGSFLDEAGQDDNDGRSSESPVIETIPGNVTTSIGSVFSSRDDDTDDGQSEDSSLRGILKNKPVKPKPYHLGDNLDSGNSLWGVRLKPIENQHTTWRHSADFDSIATKKLTDDAIEMEFKNLVNSIDDKPTTNQYQSTVTNNGYSTKINLSALPTLNPAAAASKDSSALFTTSSSSSLSSAHKSSSSTFTSFADSRPTNGNEAFKDRDQRLKGHKISIDLKLPHPSSIDTIMDELKSTSLIIKTMKSTSYFDDAMRHLEQESPLIRTSSLRLNQEALPKSSSTSMMFRKKPDGAKYSSSLDGDRGILDGRDTTRDDDFEFLNGFLEENRKFQLSIAQKEKKSPTPDRPVAAPRLKKIINSNVQLSQQLSQLKHLYDIANDSDDNAKADEEVKSYLSMNDEEKSSELSGSWSRVRVKKIASAFQSTSTSKSSESAKWPKVPLTSLYESSTTKPVEAPPRTSLIQIGSSSEKVNSNIYSNVASVQDNSVKVNIQNFESRSPALSRNNSLRIKKDDTSGVQRKLSTGTRQLRDHELTYFGVHKPTTTTTTDPKFTKSSFAHLPTNKSSSTTINTSLKSNTNTTTSTVVINHQKEIDQSKPDLIMHHQHKKFETSSTPELSSSEKKSMIEALDSCIDETKNLEPLYENLYQNQKVKYDRKTDLARDEKILNELTRAADEIMNTCKEMYHADSEEKRRKSLLSNTTCLETITEGRQQRISLVEQKVMKSKGVQVSRNFEDSLRRYHPTPQRTSSQSSIDSLPRNAKLSSLSSSASRTKRPTATKSSESTVSSTKSSSSRRRENGTNSDGSKHRVHRVSSRERMHQSNASSSEDLPNSSTEAPRRPRRTKVIKHKDENGKDEKKTSSTSRVSRTTESSLRKSTTGGSVSRVSETKVRLSSAVKSSAHNSSSSSAHPASTPTTYVSETVMIPPRRRNYQRRKIVRRNSSLKARNPTKRISRQTRRTQLESCICS